MTLPGTPCFRCGVRPDVDCPHRPADPDWAPSRPIVSRPPDRRASNGLNFKTRTYVSGGGRYRHKKKATP